MEPSPFAARVVPWVPPAGLPTDVWSAALAASVEDAGPDAGEQVGVAGASWGDAVAAGAVLLLTWRLAMGLCLLGEIAVFAWLDPATFRVLFPSVDFGYAALSVMAGMLVLAGLGRIAAVAVVVQSLEHIVLMLVSSPPLGVIARSASPSFEIWTTVVTGVALVAVLARPGAAGRGVAVWGRRRLAVVLVVAVVLYVIVVNELFALYAAGSVGDVAVVIGQAALTALPLTALVLLVARVRPVRRSVATGMAVVVYLVLGVSISWWLARARAAPLSANDPAPVVLGSVAGILVYGIPVAVARLIAPFRSVAPARPASASAWSGPPDLGVHDDDTYEV